jgi:putative Holliday junction resolvase
VGILAIDPGTRKVGFAFADRLRISQRPLPSLRTEGDEERLLAHVAGLIEEREVSTILVGLPLHKSGDEGERARDVRRLIDRLSERFPELRVLAYDERLTTKEAESRLREEGHRGRRIAELKDSWSALVLLEDWVRSGEPA